MSTRANIVVSQGDTRVYLYRHCDGYLAECGADLLAKLRAAENMSAFLLAMLSETYEKQSYEKQAKHVYEVTNMLHGDIEHAYYIRFESVSTRGGPKVRHAARPSLRHNPDVAQIVWTKYGKPVCLDEFAHAVNADRAQCNARIRKLKEEQPQAYADCGEYEAVS